MKVTFTRARRNTESGFTLTELIVALSITASVALLALSTLFFFNRAMVGENEEIAEIQQEYRHIYTYLQKQINLSEKIYIKSERVYMQDPESPKDFYNYYMYISGKYLYRYKVNKDTLSNIGPGESSQLGGKVSRFIFKAEQDEAGAFTGNINLKVGFDLNNGEEKIYEAILAYPNGKNNIIKK